MILSIRLAHFSEKSFADTTSLTRTDSAAPSRSPSRGDLYGGGNPLYRRGVANMEMGVALRTLLRELRLARSDEPG